MVTVCLTPLKIPQTSFSDLLIHLGGVQVSAAWLFKHLLKIYIYSETRSLVVVTSIQLPDVGVSFSQNRLPSKQVDTLELKWQKDDTL